MKVINSRHFEPWLAQENISLAVSTYTAGKLMLVGRKSTGGLGLFERTFNRCMGLWADGQTLFAGTAFQIWRFENILEDNAIEGDYDHLLVPRTGHVTGDIDVHDLAWSGDRLWFITTLFSSLATLSERASFKPEWQPGFITKLAAEDRCHLNGLAIVDGKPRFVTAVAACDSAAAWRDHRADGGVVIDIDSDEVIARGLSMPHSPRWYRDKLWLLDSGSGRLGYLDGERFEPVAFMPGYARGLAFSGDYAIVGVSRPRNEPTLPGCRWNRNWKSAMQPPSAAFSWCACRPAMSNTGSSSVSRSTNSTTWPCCPACAGPRRWGSRPTKSATRSTSRAIRPSGKDNRIKSSCILG